MTADALDPLIHVTHRGRAALDTYSETIRGLLTGL
jgi:hypothetical protein